jgi:serine/threonine-protein kinase HipA
MENIYIYADFDFLEQAEEIGDERVRGNDHFTFEFSREWLSRHGDMILSGDVMNLRGSTSASGRLCVWFRQRFFPRQVGADTSGQKGTIGCAARAKTSKDSQQL